MKFDRCLGFRAGTLFVLCFALHAVPAAEPNSAWFYRAWQTDDGLPANSVTGITQTPDGRLWVATHAGLASFDGIKFREVLLPLPAERANPLIRCLTQDRTHQLWLALEGGLVIRLGDRGSGAFTAADGLPNFRPLSLASAGDGAVWVSYADGSACRLAGNEVTRFTARDGLSGTGQCVLAGDNSGNIWFSKAGYCGLLDKEHVTVLHSLPSGFTRLAAAREGGIWICSGRRLLRATSATNPPVTVGEIPVASIGVEPAALYEDRSGSLWIGTVGGGVFRFDGLEFHSVRTSHADVLALAEDREGNLWAGTDGGGLDRIRKRMLELQDSDEGLPTSTLRSICEDSAGTMWAVAQNGELSRLTDGTWQRVSQREGWSEAKALCVVSDGSGGVWVGTYHAGLHHWDGTRWSALQRDDGLGGEVVRGLLLDRQGSLWLAIEGASCVQRLRDGRFDTFVQPTNSRPVRALAEDALGTLWFGTLDGYLLRLEGDELVDETQRTLAAPKPIRCLLPTEDGSLWIGYAGAGLGHLRDGRFKRISTAEGLPDTYISGMMVDEAGCFWFASDRGIFQVRQRDLEALLEGGAEQVHPIVYGRDEALPNLQANYGYAPGSARGRDGRIWFPMRTGLAVVYPDRVTPRRMPPAVTLEQVVVDGQPAVIKPGELMRVRPDHRRLEIEYTAFSFVAPEDIIFRHQLEGWDEDWVEGGNSRRVNFSRLPAGAYRLRVSARSPAGAWNPAEAAVAFIVEPFAWQTWWFRGGALALFTCAVIVVVRYVSHRRLRARLLALEQEAALHKERARIAKDIHDDLGACLTQISLLGRLGEHDLREPEKAGEHLRKISLAARQGVKAVGEIVWAVNPRNDTVAHLLDYAGQYAVDFLQVAGIRCRVDFPEECPHRILTAEARHSLFLMLKEALNNAVKHAGAGEVRVRAELDQDVLRLSVEDDGRGFSDLPDSGLSDGLRNMRQRLADLGGECRVVSVPGHGTRVSAELRLSGQPAQNGTNAQGRS